MKKYLLILLGALALVPLFAAGKTIEIPVGALHRPVQHGWSWSPAFVEAQKLLPYWGGRKSDGKAGTLRVLQDAMVSETILLDGRIGLKGADNAGLLKIWAGEGRDANGQWSAFQGDYLLRNKIEGREPRISANSNFRSNYENLDLELRGRPGLHGLRLGLSQFGYIKRVKVSNCREATAFHIERGSDSFLMEQVKSDPPAGGKTDVGFFFDRVLDLTVIGLEVTGARTGIKIRDPRNLFIAGVNFENVGEAPFPDGTFEGVPIDILCRGPANIIIPQMSLGPSKGKCLIRLEIAESQLKKVRVEIGWFLKRHDKHGAVLMDHILLVIHRRKAGEPVGGETEVISIERIPITPGRGPGKWIYGPATIRTIP